VYVHRVPAGPGGAKLPVLVLLHGYMMSHWYFQALHPTLARTHRVIAIDLPGYGESDRPSPERYGYDYLAFAHTVLEVLDRLELERVSLLGHSMGGGVALTLAARWAERVERLVLECPAIYRLELPFYSGLLLKPKLGPLLFGALTRGEMRRQMARQHFKDPSAITDELIDYVWARLHRAGGCEAAWATLRTFASLSNATAEPMRVRAPTLLLWGDEDRMIPLSHGKRLARSIPGAELSVVAASGHNVHLERRDQFLRQLTPFLEDETVRPISAPAAPPAWARSIDGALGGAS
jgi:pimeloyl-ACP methyl ester carboxylesterase